MTDFERSLISHLSSFVTEKRLATMRRVLSQRTRYLTAAVEDIYQPHNASAVLRTCDAVGIQDVHIIENRNTYRVNPGVELGTAQWLSLHRYRGKGDMTVQALNHLRASGYRIVVTTPHAGDTDLEAFDLDAGKAALVFGNELDGISGTAQANADEFLRIPMCGFVESFNISVSAAIILYSLTQRLRRGTIRWELDQSERETLMLRWLRGTLEELGIPIENQ